MKNQIKIIVKSKKMEASFLAILSLFMLLIGIYISHLMSDPWIDAEVPIGSFHKFFMKNSTFIAGLLGIILSYLQFNTARKIESAEQS